MEPENRDTKGAKRRRAGTLIRVSLVVFACIGFLTARIIWPSARIDSTSIWLLVIAAVIILAPELRRLLPYVSEAKIGPVTVKVREIREEIQKVVEETNAVEEAMSQDPEFGFPVQTAQEVEDIRTLLRSNTDPRQVLVMLSIDLEKKVSDRLKEAAVPAANRPLSLMRMVDLGYKAGIFPEEYLSIIKEFWRVRNAVVHSVEIPIDNATLYSLIDAGLEVLSLLSVEKITKVIESRDEEDLTREDYASFKAIASIVQSTGDYYQIPDGQAIRRTTKAGETDVITAIYPIEYGQRYVQYRVNTTEGTDRLVKVDISETVRPGQIASS